MTTEPDRKKLKELIVHVGGAPYPAVVDAKGVLRFKFNWAVVQAHESSTKASAFWADPMTDGADMNALAYRFQTLEPRPSLRQYAEYHMLIGYSLDGFCELSAFQALEVHTPQWTRKGVRPWGPPLKKKKKTKK